MRFFMWGIVVTLVYQASSSPAVASSLLMKQFRAPNGAYGDVNINVNSNLFCIGDKCYEYTRMHGDRLKRGLDNDGFNLRSATPRKGEYICTGGVCRSPPRLRGSSLTPAACPHCQFAVKP